MSETKVVSIKKQYLVPEYQSLLEWLEDDSHVYIGRNMSFYVKGAVGSKWANPFKVAKPNKVYKRGKYYTLDDSLKLYEEYIKRTPELLNSLHELHNKTLGCWCKPNACHGDILVKLVNDQSN